MGVVLKRVDTIDALFARVTVLERLVRQLTNTNQLGATSIDKGALIVRGGALVAEDVDGSTLLYVGQGALPGVPDSAQAFMFFARADGRVFFRLNSLAAGDQFWAFYDETGNIIFSDDTISGQGMARPYVPIPTRTIGALDPANGHIGVTSAAFTEFAIVEGLKQHPKIHLGVSAFADDGATAGTVQLVNAFDGEVLGSVDVDAGTVTATSYTITSPVEGEHLTHIRLSVQAQRTAGAAALRVIPRFAYGIQS